jgi:hypothetical protein
MRCQCRLPCRDEPLDEVDALCVAFLLLLAGACAAYVACGSACADMWIPLAVGGLLCATMARHCHQHRASGPRAELDDAA